MWAPSGAGERWAFSDEDVAALDPVLFRQKLTFVRDSCDVGDLDLDFTDVYDDRTADDHKCASVRPRQSVSPGADVAAHRCRSRQSFTITLRRTALE
jgi:hypothetical protein